MIGKSMVGRRVTVSDLLVSWREKANSATEESWPAPIELKSILDSSPADVLAEHDRTVAKQELLDAAADAEADPYDVDDPPSQWLRDRAEKIGGAAS